MSKILNERTFNKYHRHCKDKYEKDIEVGDIVVFASLQDCYLAVVHHFTATNVILKCWDWTYNKYTWTFYRPGYRLIKISSKCENFLKFKELLDAYGKELCNKEQDDSIYDM